MIILLKILIKNIWSGDVGFQEVEKTLSESDLLEAEDFLNNYPQYIDGVPFQEDCKEWADLVKNNSGAKIIQRIIDLLD